MSYKIALQIIGIKDGVISFKMPDDFGFRERLTKYIGNEQSIVCEFSKIRKRRSTGDGSQNHHLNGHIVDIMKACGMTTKKEYDQVKTEVKRIAHFTFGYPSDKTGHFFKSESECNSEECAWLIESAHLLAAELGIVLTETF